MRVLIVSNLYYPNIIGGAEKVAQNLAGALVDRGHDVAVVTLKDPRGRPELVEANSVRVHYLPLRNLYFTFPQKKRTPVTKALWHALDIYNPFMIAPIAAVIAAERPDVVNTHNVAGFSSSAWVAAKRLGTPLVHTCHDYHLLCVRSNMISQGGRNCTRPCVHCTYHSWPRRKLSHLVDVAIPVSQFVLDRHEQFGCFPSAEKVVIHDRNTSDYVLPEPKPCGEPRGPLRFGFLGRLHPAKGIGLLLRSFLELDPGAAQLIVAGHGEASYERKLKTMADRRREIRWLGFVPPDELLRQVDVLVVPSLWNDPSPLVVTECLAHGLPVIGSRRGGIPELMGEGTGWTFDPDEPGALVVTLQHAIASRNEFGVIGERAIQRARQFPTDALVNAYLRAYERAIEKNRKTV